MLWMMLGRMPSTKLNRPNTTQMVMPRGASTTSPWKKYWSIRLNRARIVSRLRVVMCGFDDKVRKNYSFVVGFHPLTKALHQKLTMVSILMRCVHPKQFAVQHKTQKKIMETLAP